jgi:hypothetical protein
LGVGFGHRVDGAVGQHDRAVGAVWCVPALSQRFAGAGEKPFPFALGPAAARAWSPTTSPASPPHCR